MRLTLRTLLAYLDDVLDPADKEELAKKIESSEFAEDLVHRTRDTMRRLRLSAPQVVGTGMGLDPNSVAEYLDNALSPEQVGEFERICLESDVHLAETAACHHVLTMVLGEPAEVEPRARQRMYHIAGEIRERKQLRIEPAHNLGMTSALVTSAPAPVITPMVPVQTAPVVRAREVPEYLRTGSFWPKLALATLAAVLLLGVGLTFSSGMRGWFGGDTSLAELTPSDQKDITPPPASDIEPARSTDSLPAETVAAADTTASDTESTGASTVAPLSSSPPPPLTPGVDNSQAITSAPLADPYGAPPATEPASTDTAPSVVSTIPLPSGPISGETTAALTTTPAEPSDSSDASSGNVVLAPPTEIGPPTEAPADATTADTAAPPVNATALLPPTEVPPPPAADLATANVTPEMPADPSAAPADAAAATADAPPVEAVAAASNTIALPTDSDEPAAPAPPAELGTYMSTDSVLLRHDDKQGSWYRVEPRNAVTAGQRLLTLPEFRSTITLSGVIVDMMGGSEIMLTTANELAADGLAAGAANAPAIDIVFGRVVLSNRSSGEQSLRVKLGADVSDMKLARNSTVAIEVERVFVPGNDPRTTPSPAVVKVFAPEGGVDWQDAGGPRTLAAGSQWVIAGGKMSEAPAGTVMPEWIGAVSGSSPREQLQRKAAAHVSSTLLSNRPAEIQLVELYQSNVRREVKDLVARASMYVGFFEPFVNALRDPSQRWPAWESNVDALRTAMALSPDNAEKVSQALAEEHDDVAAKDLYKMLCGYSPDEVGETPDLWKAGSMVQLIDWLENDNLDYRVLAVYNLSEITGKRLTAPDATASDRRLSVRNWRKRLASGELKPQPAGEAPPK